MLYILPKNLIFDLFCIFSQQAVSHLGLSKYKRFLAISAPHPHSLKKALGNKQVGI